MTVTEHIIQALVIDAAVGLAAGVFAGRPGRSGWWAPLLISLAAAFAVISSAVVAYEVIYSTGRLAAGFAWAAMYAPVNFVLSLPAPLVCWLAALARRASGR